MLSVGLAILMFAVCAPFVLAQRISAAPDTDSVYAVAVESLYRSIAAPAGDTQAFQQALELLEQTRNESSDPVQREQLSNLCEELSAVSAAPMENRTTVMAAVDVLIQQLASDSPEQIFSACGGFITSYGMMDRKISDITWSGTHNSYSGPSGTGGGITAEFAQNHGLTLKQQMEQGIRWLDMDFNYINANPFGDVAFIHNIYVSQWVTLDIGLNQIKQFVEEHPTEIIVFEMSDIASLCSEKKVYEQLEQAFLRTGLAKYVYNMQTKTGDYASWLRYPANQDDPDDPNVPFINPTISEMLAAGKNVLIVPFRNQYPKDRAYNYPLEAGSEPIHDFRAVKFEERAVSKAVWDPEHLAEQSENPLRFMSLEYDPDDNASAGSRSYAARNNDGRKLYQLANYYESVMPDDKHINYFRVDFYNSSMIGEEWKSVVHAANTLNRDRFGFIADDEYLVQLTPFDKGVDILRSNPVLMEEVGSVYENSAGNAEWSPAYQDSHLTGMIRATDRRRHKSGVTPLNWWCNPEFAMDGDFATAWSADNEDDLFIDLGEPTAFDQIYISWEFQYARPEYRVLVSNDTSHEGDWTQKEFQEVYSAPMMTSGNDWFEKVCLNISEDYRYLCIDVTDAAPESGARAGISEIFVYHAA